MKIRFLFLMATLFLLPGCVSSGGAGSNAHWYNPATWFSGSEGRSAAALGQDVAAGQKTLFKGAQTTAHETQEALKAAPQDNRAVQVAQEANDHTVAQLDQAEGPLTTTQLDKLVNQVALLLSDNVKLRAEGEKLRADERDEQRANSEKLAKKDAMLEKANANLLTGFERENAVANTLRNYEFGVVGLGILLVVFTVLYIYARLSLGGLTGGIGLALTKYRASNPDQAGVLSSILNDIVPDKHLNAIEAKSL